MVRYLLKFQNGDFHVLKNFNWKETTNNDDGPTIGRYRDIILKSMDIKLVAIFVVAGKRRQRIKTFQ